MTDVQRSALALMIVLSALLNPTRGQDGQRTVAGQPWLFSGKVAPISQLTRDAGKKALMKRAVSCDILPSYLDELLRLLRAQRDSWTAGLSTLNSLVTRVQDMKSLDLLNRTDVEAPGMEVEEQVTLPAWFTQRTQLCYQWYPDGDGGQCGGGADRLLCAAPGTMTSYYRDDTDGRSGGCQMQWGVITSREADWFRQVQVCYRWYPDGDGGQCGGGAAQELCAPVNSYTPYYRDDSDGRGGGCQMSWRLVVPSNAPAWALNLQLCYVWYPDGDGGQCGGGASRNLCARANDWTAYYRDDTDGRGGGCQMSWGIKLN